MFFVLRTLLDPFFEQCELLGSDLLVRLGWRHANVGVFFFDELNHRRASRVTGLDYWFAILAWGKGVFFAVETQRFFLWFAGAGIGAVAVITGISENRLDVFVEGNDFRECKSRLAAGF